MATNRNDAIHVKRWKLNHPKIYIAYNRKNSLANFYFKKQVKEFLRIDPTLFS